MQGHVTYSIFIYQCDQIRWTLHNAAVGFSVNGTFYENHKLSRHSSVVNIDCDYAVSSWTNIVYKIDIGKYVINSNNYLAQYTGY